MPHGSVGVFATCNLGWRCRREGALMGRAVARQKIVIVSTDRSIVGNCCAVARGRPFQSFQAMDTERSALHLMQDYTLHTRLDERFRRQDRKLRRCGKLKALYWIASGRLAGGLAALPLTCITRSRDLRSLFLSKPESLDQTVQGASYLGE